MATDAKLDQGTTAWLEMAGTLMCEAAARAGLPPDLSVSLVERYTDGAELPNGLVQGLRFDIVAGTLVRHNTRGVRVWTRPAGRRAGGFPSSGRGARRRLDVRDPIEVRDHALQQVDELRGLLVREAAQRLAIPPEQGCHRVR